MPIIKQTNRTILMESFNPNKLDLMTLIGNVEDIESLTDEKIKEIDEYLLVKSFDEFLEKFEPTVYSVFNVETQRIIYTTQKPENIPSHLVRSVVLNKENDFIDMLLTLIKAKQSKDNRQHHFQFDNVLNLLAPERQIEDICKWRKEIRLLYKKMVLVDEQERKESYREIERILEEASESYYDVAAMLPLAIEDIKMYLILNEKQEGLFTSPLLSGILNMDNEGELSILEAPHLGHNLEALDKEINEGIAQLVKKHFQKIYKDENEYIEQLVLRTFCPLMGNKDQEIDIEEEVDRYNAYLGFYKMMQEEFIQVAKPLIENIIGVYMFFNQYQTETKEMEPTLLVTNISGKRLVQLENEKRLRVYLNTVNSKNHFSHTIWFGIIPSIPFEQKEKFFITRERFKGNKQMSKGEKTDLQILEEVMQILKDYRIQTFFSFSIGEKTTFQYIARKGISFFIERCRPIIRKTYSEFLIPCIPNFTLIPRENSTVVLGAKMHVTDENKPILLEEQYKFWIDGLFIKAAYVAAGLVSAYQCPSYLQTCFKKNVAKELPGVRYDIESNDSAIWTRTTLAKEIPGLSYKWQEEIKEKEFGFIFDSRNIKNNHKNIKEITVTKARSLKYDGEHYEPIFRTLVVTYIERILRYATTDFKKDQLAKFFSSHPNSQKSRWLEKKECVNAILKENDNISYVLDEKEQMCIVTLTLNDHPKRLEIAIEGSEA